MSSSSTRNKYIRAAQIVSECIACNLAPNAPTAIYDWKHHFATIGAPFCVSLQLWSDCVYRDQRNCVPTNKRRATTVASLQKHLSVDSRCVKGLTWLRIAEFLQSALSQCKAPSTEDVTELLCFGCSGVACVLVGFRLFSCTCNVFLGSVDHHHRSGSVKHSADSSPTLSLVCCVEISIQKSGAIQCGENHVVLVNVNHSVNKVLFLYLFGTLTNATKWYKKKENFLVETRPVNSDHLEHIATMKPPLFAYSCSI